MAVRTLIVDDSRTMQHLVKAELERSDAISVIGVASSAQEAREMIKALDPDVITLDIEMDGMSGLEFLERIMTLRPTPTVMVSSLSGVPNTRSGPNCSSKPEVEPWIALWSSTSNPKIKTFGSRPISRAIASRRAAEYVRMRAVSVCKDMIEGPFLFGKGAGLGIVDRLGDGLLDGFVDGRNGL